MLGSTGKNKVKNKSEVLIAYIPVLHEGYRKLLATHSDTEVFVFGQEIVAKFDYLKKEIRALEPQLVVEAIKSWGIVRNISVLTLDKLQELQKTADKIIMPDEDVCKEMAAEFFKDKEVIFDKIFLRWDKHNSFIGQPIAADQDISEEKFDKKMCEMAEAEATKSSDWWRHVGGVLVKEGKVILISHNKHVPSEHMPYAVGDPRNAYHKGTAVELSTAIHAEAGIIAEAAAKGISLADTSLYVSIFPCPPCAKLIAYSGIKNLYYSGGYGVLDGESVLKAKGVKIIYVKK